MHRAVIPAAFPGFKAWSNHGGWAILRALLVLDRLPTHWLEVGHWEDAGHAVSNPFRLCWSTHELTEYGIGPMGQWVAIAGSCLSRPLAIKLDCLYPLSDLTSQKPEEPRNGKKYDFPRQLEQ